MNAGFLRGVVNKVTLTVDPRSEVIVTEIINHNLGRRTGYIFASKDPNDKDAIEIHDGHHSMDELYTHRIHLFLALLKVWDTYITPIDARGSLIRCWKSKQHDDGSMYDGWFIAGMTKTIQSFDAGADPEKFDISYHLPIKYWNICTVMELEKAPKFTGYTSDDVLERLLRL